MDFTNLNIITKKIQCTAQNDGTPFISCEFDGEDASWVEKEIDKICFINIESFFSKTDSFKNRISNEVGFTYRFKRPVKCSVIGSNDKCLTVKCMDRI